MRRSNKMGLLGFQDSSLIVFSSSSIKRGIPQKYFDPSILVNIESDSKIGSINAIVRWY
jgi:hypothetical protein